MRAAIILAGLISLSAHGEANVTGQKAKRLYEALPEATRSYTMGERHRDTSRVSCDGLTCSLNSQSGRALVLKGLPAKSLSLALKESGAEPRQPLEVKCLEQEHNGKRDAYSCEVRKLEQRSAEQRAEASPDSSGAAQ